MPGNSARWLRRIYPSNPAYLMSAVLVLFGLQMAFGNRDRVADGSLLTSLFCGYSLALAGVGILVIRLGRLWEDARTVLLVLLLMFAALSTAFDQLCLNRWRAGAANLATGFAFCVVVSEWVLYSLALRLPTAYRVPYYLQLGALFGFPPLLGWYSLDGRSVAMCQGVLAFCAAAGVSVLCLLPAAVRGRERLRPPGAPWPWPLYPWSIFVLLLVAMGVRTWTVCISFSPTKGADSAFLPYLLVPLAAATAVLLLVLGWRHRSPHLQRAAAGVATALPLLVEPFWEPSRAQSYLLEILWDLVGNPLLAALCCTAALGCIGVALRARWAEPVAIASMTVLLSLDANALTLRDAHPLSNGSIGLLTAWILVRAAVSRSFLQLGVGVTAAWLIAKPSLGPVAAVEVTPLQQACLVLLWLLAAPLVCRDRHAAFFRRTAPLWLLLASVLALVVLPSCWPPRHGWTAPAAGATIALEGQLYLAVTKNRWCLAASCVSGGAAACVWLLLMLASFDNYFFRNGMRLYAAGFATLGIGLLVSLCKAGYAWRVFEWLEVESKHSPHARIAESADAG